LRVPANRVIDQQHHALVRILLKGADSSVFRITRSSPDRRDDVVSVGRRESKH